MERLLIRADAACRTEAEVAGANVEPAAANSEMARVIFVVRIIGRVSSSPGKVEVQTSTGDDDGGIRASA